MSDGYETKVTQSITNKGGKWLLNQKQRATVIIGITLVVVSGLLVPYDGECIYDNCDLSGYLGYYLLFDPPKQYNIYKQLRIDEYVVENAKMRGADIVLSQKIAIKSCKARVKISQLIIQMSLIIIITIGFIFILAKKTSGNDYVK